MNRIMIACAALALTACTEEMTAEVYQYHTNFAENEAPAEQHSIIELFAEPIMEVLEEPEEEYTEEDYYYSAEEYESYYNEYEWEAYEEEYEEYYEESEEDYGPWSEANPEDWGGEYDPETGLIDYGGGRYGAVGEKGWMAVFGGTEEEYDHLHDGDE